MKNMPQYAKLAAFPRNTSRGMALDLEFDSVQNMLFRILNPVNLVAAQEILLERARRVYNQKTVEEYENQLQALKQLRDNCENEENEFAIAVASLCVILDHSTR